MNWTAQQLETAFGMTGITLENGVIATGDGLALSTANTRLQACLAAGKLPADAKAYQVRTWFIRHGISLDAIPSIISTSVPEGPARDEALIRWEYCVQIPMDHPLVSVVAVSLNMKVQDIWWDILQL